jgi:hypothetical protein
MHCWRYTRDSDEVHLWQGQGWPRNSRFETVHHAIDGKDSCLKRFELVSTEWGKQPLHQVVLIPEPMLFAPKTYWRAPECCTSWEGKHTTKATPGGT